MDAGEIILERLTFLRNEVAYLKQERDRLRSFKKYRVEILTVTNASCCECGGYNELE